MLEVLPNRVAGGLLVLMLVTAASAGFTAEFSAPEPGADLEPVGAAASTIRLLQGDHSILWASLAGPVAEITTLGWPSSNVDVDLSGALVIERPQDPDAGTIDFGEKPQTVVFTGGG